MNTTHTDKPDLSADPRNASIVTKRTRAKAAAANKAREAAEARATAAEAERDRLLTDRVSLIAKLDAAEARIREAVAILEDDDNYRVIPDHASTEEGKEYASVLCSVLMVLKGGEGLNLTTGPLAAIQALTGAATPQDAVHRVSDLLAQVRAMRYLVPQRSPHGGLLTGIVAQYGDGRVERILPQQWDAALFTPAQSDVTPAAQPLDYAQIERAAAEWAADPQAQADLAAALERSNAQADRLSEEMRYRPDNRPDGAAQPDVPTAPPACACKPMPQCETPEATSSDATACPVHGYPEWTAPAAQPDVAREVAEALRDAMPLIEAAEDAQLVGDEGCLWPAENARAALEQARASGLLTEGGAE